MERFFFGGQAWRCPFPSRVVGNTPTQTARPRGHQHNGHVIGERVRRPLLPTRARIKMMCGRLYLEDTGKNVAPEFLAGREKHGRNRSPSRRHHNTLLLDLACAKFPFNAGRFVRADDTRKGRPTKRPVSEPGPSLRGISADACAEGCKKALEIINGATVEEREREKRSHPSAAAAQITSVWRHVPDDVSWRGGDREDRGK